jgi:uncharacterized protein YhfF
VNETISTDNFPELPLSEFAFPGPLRDRLISAILDGRKVTTTSLALEYEIEREPLPSEGQRSVVVDSNNQPVCVIETVEVLIVPLGEVGYEHVVNEGEGHATVSDWRAAHENFWHSKEMTDSLGETTFVLGDATLVVLERFRVIERLRSTAN